MRAILSVAAVLAFASCSLQSFAADPANSGEKNGPEMSLELYQKLKGHFEALYGTRTGLLVQAPSKDDAEKELRADAAANKDALIAALGSPKTIHRELAARALEYCGDKASAVAALVKNLNSDSDENVRRAMAAALAKMPDANAVDALAKGLGDTSDSVRSSCVIALGNIKDNRASAPLMHVLADDSKPMVRMLAATSLSRINDPATLDGLKKLLDVEKDERVKMAIAGAMRGLMGGNSPQTEGVPTTENAAGELAALAKEMKEVEEKLRSDRHDQAVQVQGGGIEKKLATLIEKLDKACNSGSGSKPGQKEEQQKQSGSKENNGPKQAGSPMKNSQLGSRVEQGAMNPAMVSGRDATWAKLPPAQRDELLQAFRDEVPERWQSRLKAYFYSIAAEEAEKADK